MQKLRIKVELNKGRHGISLGKFAGIASDMGIFLSKLSDDLLLSSEKWVASNFKNGSVIFDLEKNCRDAEELKLGQNAIRAVITNDRQSPYYNRVSSSTKISFASLAKRLESDEAIGISIYHNGEETPDEIGFLNKDRAAEITGSLERQVKYFGEVQGVVHSFYKEASPQYLKIRQLSTGDLVACFFDTTKYQSAVNTMDQPDAVLFIEGEITENLATGSIESIKVSDFYFAPDFDLNFHLGFIGARPNLTENDASETFVEKLRADGGY